MYSDTHPDTDVVVRTTFLAPHAEAAGVCLRVNPYGAGYLLEWTDFVANDWSEEFPELPAALARLALLAHCASTGWEAGFTSEPLEFTEKWRDFAESSVN